MIIQCSKCEKWIDTDEDVDFDVDENNNVVCYDCLVEEEKK